MRYAVLAAALLAAMPLSLPAPVAAHDAAAQSALAQALAHERRAGDRARDVYRHPAETLAFFEVEPGMTVVDYMPAGGWYSRVLVPYLGSEGRYIGLMPDPAASSDEGMANYFGQLPGRFAAAWPGWNLPGAPVSGMSSADMTEEMAGSADRVLIFREMHNLFRSGALHTELSRIRTLLADDGMLGIVQHRAPAWASGDFTDGGNGYLRQSDVIGLVEAHGFELVSTSEVNANPSDPANWEGGVWSLPPTFSGAEEGTAERARRAAIGESDRMTLLFRKRM